VKTIISESDPDTDLSIDVLNGSSPNVILPTTVALCQYAYYDCLPNASSLRGWGVGSG